jgi:DNA repair exonuclease SbcCD ATPase subunit
VDQLKAEATALGGVIVRVEGLLTGGPNLIERPCVLSERIPCLTPAKDFKGAVTQLKKDVKALEARIKAGTKRRSSFRTCWVAAATSAAQVTYHQDQVAKLQQQLDEATTWAGKVADLAKQVAGLEQQVTAGDGPVQAAQAEADKLQAQQTALATYRAQLMGQAKAVAERDKLAAELTVAEALVDLLGPKGIRAKVLQDAVGDFEAAINSALAAFGFSLGINVDPWRVEVCRPAMNGWVSFEMLSAGEQLWTGLAFQLALAALSGLDFCCLDAAEGVVGRRREILTGLVMGAPVGQVVVAMAKPEDEPAPVLPGLQVIRTKALVG